ncbi:unnamed protein product [Cercospora beticola]|nr:unnamed protein product [Cercospora beticola]
MAAEYSLKNDGRSANRLLCDRIMYVLELFRAEFFVRVVDRSFRREACLISTWIGTRVEASLQLHFATPCCCGVFTASCFAGVDKGVLAGGDCLFYLEWLSGEPGVLDV